jgi:hypothetical protein
MTDTAEEAVMFLLLHVAQTASFPATHSRAVELMDRLKAEHAVDQAENRGRKPKPDKS